MSLWWQAEDFFLPAPEGLNFNFKKPAFILHEAGKSASSGNLQYINTTKQAFGLSWGKNNSFITHILGGRVTFLFFVVKIAINLRAGLPLREVSAAGKKK